MSAELSEKMPSITGWHIINHTLRITIALALVILCVYLYPHVNSENINSFMEKYSTSAPVIFILLCMAQPVLFFMPPLGLTILAGLLFGTVHGTIYVSIGGALSTIVGFYFARWLGQDTLKKVLRSYDSLKKIEKWSEQMGKKSILLMRLFNLPWDLVSYWAGLSKIRFRDFYIASVIPLVPISFLYTYFGSHIFNPISAEFIIPLFIMFIMGSIPYMIKLRLKTSDE